MIYSSVCERNVCALWGWRCIWTYVGFDWCSCHLRLHQICEKKPECKRYIVKYTLDLIAFWWRCKVDCPSSTAFCLLWKTQPKFKLRLQTPSQTRRRTRHFAKDVSNVKRKQCSKSFKTLQWRATSNDMQWFHSRNATAKGSHSPLARICGQCVRQYESGVGISRNLLPFARGRKDFLFWKIR